MVHILPCGTLQRHRSCDTSPRISPEGYLAALEVKLEPVHYRRLDEVSAPRLGAPHEDVAAALAHGVDGNRDLLDAPAVPIA